MELGSQGCIYKVVIDKLMICCDVPGGAARPDLEVV